MELICTRLQKRSNKNLPKNNLFKDLPGAERPLGDLNHQMFHFCLETAQEKKTCGQECSSSISLKSVKDENLLRSGKWLMYAVFLAKNVQLFTYINGCLHNFNLKNVFVFLQCCLWHCHLDCVEAAF